MMAMPRSARVSTAVGLAAAVVFGVAASAAAQAPRKAGGHFSIHGQRPSFHEDDIEQIEVVVSGADSEGRMSLVESIWLPAFSVPAHYHTSHAETFYIIAGKVEWTIGGQTRVVGAGDAVHIPPYTVHSVRVIERMHSLMIYQSGGYEEAVAADATFTTQQKKDPKIQALLTRIGDFNRVGGAAAAPATAAGQPARAVPVFSIRGQRGSFPERDVENVELVLTGAQSEGRLSIIESFWLPGFAAEPHFHRAHAETFYVLDGEVEWTVGGRTQVLKKGDAVHIPPNTLHSVRVTGAGKLHSLMLSDPGGYEEIAAERATYTPEQLKDPQVSQRLRRLGDVHVVPKPR